MSAILPLVRVADVGRNARELTAQFRDDAALGVFDSDVARRNYHEPAIRPLKAAGIRRHGNHAAVLALACDEAGRDLDEPTVTAAGGRRSGGHGG